MQSVPSLDEMLQVLSLSLEEYVDIVNEDLVFTGKGSCIEWVIWKHKVVQDKLCLLFFL